MLLNYGAQVNEKDNFCFTALHYACKTINDPNPMLRLDKIRLLIERGADLNAL